MCTSPNLTRFGAKRSSGFTLIELMVVVVIIGILATVAIGSYRRFSRRARVQEAIAMLGDIRIKQETYYQTYHRYVSTSTSNTEFWPHVADWTLMDTAWGIDCTQPSDVTAHPGWCALGAGYRVNEQVNFEFQVLARDPAAPVAPPVTYIQNPAQDWWYARARADFDVNGVFSDIYLSSELKEPVLMNELE